MLIFMELDGKTYILSYAYHNYVLFISKNSVLCIYCIICMSEHTHTHTHTRVIVSLICFVIEILLPSISFITLEW